MSERRVASLAEVKAGEPRLVEIDGTRIVLTRLGDHVYAMADACAHQGGPLHEGKQSGARLACPWHGWMYDVRSGQCLLPARGGAIATYPVRIESGEIWVDMP